MKKKPNPSLKLDSPQPSISFNLNQESQPERSSLKHERWSISQSPELFSPLLQSPSQKELSKPKSKYSSMDNIPDIPIVIKDQEYLHRKQTFDTFMKAKDLKFLIRSDSQKVPETNQSLSTNSVQSKLKKELTKKMKTKKGKMYVNELWSMDYYSEVINDSNLKKNYDSISLLKLKPVEVKLQEAEDHYQRSLTKLRSIANCSPMPSINFQTSLSPLIRPNIVEPSSPNSPGSKPGSPSPRASVSLRQGEFSKSLSRLKAIPLDIPIQEAEAEDQTQKHSVKILHEKRNLSKLKDIANCPGSPLFSFQQLANARTRTSIREPASPTSSSSKQGSPSPRAFHGIKQGEFSSNCGSHLSKVFSQQSPPKIAKKHRHTLNPKQGYLQDEYALYFEPPRTANRGLSVLSTPMSSPIFKVKKGNDQTAGSMLLSPMSARNPKPLNMKISNFKESRKYSRNTSLEPLDSSKQNQGRKYGSQTQRDLSEETETQRKVKQLMENCLDLNMENRSFKKELEQERNNLGSHSSRKKEIAKDRQTQILADAIKDRVKYLQKTRFRKMENPV